MNITFEKLGLDEIRSSLREQSVDSFPDLQDERRLSILSEKWFSNAEFCTCRDDDGRLIGMVVFYANQPDGGFVYITHVYVKSGFRSQGIMTSMFRAIEKRAIKDGFNSLRLEVKKDNETAQRAYSRFGFSSLGEASEGSVFMQYVFFTSLKELL